MHRRIATTALLLGSLLLLPACTTVVTETAKKAFEDRSSEDQATDIRMATSYFSALLDKDKNLALDVSLDVWEQRVLITGALTDARQRQEVEALVRADKRARMVYNEILLVSKEAQSQRRDAARNKSTPKKEGIGQSVNDFWIETKISAQLLTTQGVTSVNYRWRCVYGTVYVIGRALSRNELNTVLGTIRATEGVKQVKSFVDVRGTGH
ncbi:BON domain-containing protein [Curvibacter sp. APW13]|uniref:BON domain-containing protein n=1 Tax=Curvibacter sp. APW13 TaxID=3077236 RepID=UPI0028DDF72B|nr:BON domain-containing protein [Curvibacter sp. APW13]MDT8990384.1 BON domain-containing protein [Curvibacter sp. APW13]